VYVANIIAIYRYVYIGSFARIDRGVYIANVIVMDKGFYIASITGIEVYMASIRRESSTQWDKGNIF
jgi:hypothetical protein